MSRVQTLTADELLALRDDGFQYELIQGELRRMSPAGKVHGKVAANLTASLVVAVRTSGAGEVYAAETGFKLRSNPDHVRAPDAAFISAERLQTITEVEGFIPGSPDIAAEVVSPRDSYSDIEEKVMEWLEAGAQLVIVLNPTQRLITLYRSWQNVVVLTESDTLSAEDILPGWSVKVADLFE